MKASLSTVSYSLLGDCEIFRNLRIAFFSSSTGHVTRGSLTPDPAPPVHVAQHVEAASAVHPQVAIFKSSSFKPAPTWNLQ